MKRFVLLCMAFLSFVHANAQNKISGLVIDDQTGDILPYASALLPEINLTNSADDDGTFSFKNLQPGEYHIVVSYLGYKRDTIVIKLGKKAINILFQGFQKMSLIFRK